MKQIVVGCWQCFKTKIYHGGSASFCIQTSPFKYVASVYVTGMIPFMSSKKISCFPDKCIGKPSLSPACALNPCTRAETEAFYRDVISFEIASKNRWAQISFILGSLSSLFFQRSCREKNIVSRIQRLDKQFHVEKPRNTWGYLFLFVSMRGISRFGEETPKVGSISHSSTHFMTVFIYNFGLTQIE